MIMRAPPYTIFLQWFGDDQDPMIDDPIDPGDVTWNCDRIFDKDLEFVRLEAYNIIKQAAEFARDELYREFPMDRTFEQILERLNHALDVCP